VRSTARRYVARMQIDKAQVLELLRDAGDQAKLGQAEQELPDQVDTERHAGLLQRLGINPTDLLGRFGGGAGGLGGILG
jgi:hypothetical protein